MTVLINLSNRLMAGSMDQFLTGHGHVAVVVNEEFPVSGVSPDVLLVDIATLTYDLLARYPQARAFLIDDPVMEPWKLYAALLSYGRQGILPPYAGLQQVWIEHGSVTASFSGTRRTARKRENATGVSRALGDDESAERLAPPSVRTRHPGRKVRKVPLRLVRPGTTHNKQHTTEGYRPPSP